MAKESMKARERKRQRMVERYAEKRAALKEAGDITEEQYLEVLESLERSKAKSKCLAVSLDGLTLCIGFTVIISDKTKMLFLMKYDAIY